MSTIVQKSFLCLFFAQLSCFAESNEALGSSDGSVHKSVPVCEASFNRAIRAVAEYEARREFKSDLDKLETECSVLKQFAIDASSSDRAKLYEYSNGICSRAAYLRDKEDEKVLAAKRAIEKKKERDAKLAKEEAEQLDKENREMARAAQVAEAASGANGLRVVSVAYCQKLEQLADNLKDEAYLRRLDKESRTIGLTDHRDVAERRIDIQDSIKCYEKEARARFHSAPLNCKSIAQVEYTPLDMEVFESLQLKCE